MENHANNATLGDPPFKALVMTSEQPLLLNGVHPSFFSSEVNLFFFLAGSCFSLFTLQVQFLYSFDRTLFSPMGQLIFILLLALLPVTTTTHCLILTNRVQEYEFQVMEGFKGNEQYGK